MPGNRRSSLRMRTCPLCRTRARWTPTAAAPTRPCSPSGSRSSPTPRHTEALLHAGGLLRAARSPTGAAAPALPLTQPLTLTLKSNSNPSPNLSPEQKPITLTLTCCRASASPPARRAIGPASASPAARRANHSPAAGRAHASDMSAGDEAGGGTAIGVLVQHGVLDVDALVSE